MKKLLLIAALLLPTSASAWTIEHGSKGGCYLSYEDTLGQSEIIFGANRKQLSISFQNVYNKVKTADYTIKMQTDSGNQYDMNVVSLGRKTAFAHNVWNVVFDDLSQSEYVVARDKKFYLYDIENAMTELLLCARGYK